ncbi:MAG: hypothetical protein ACO1RX_00640 [Candidatus Sericytochromatia bacterium]
MSEAFTPPPGEPPAAEPGLSPLPRKRKNWTFWLGLGGVGVILLSFLAGLGAYQMMKFRAMAEGIATGYIEAAMTAYQMDRYARPLPDRIFESGIYRVETRTHGTPPKLHVSVRDRYVNMTHYEAERLFDVSGRPEAPPDEGQENTPRPE